MTSLATMLSRTEQQNAVQLEQLAQRERHSANQLQQMIHQTQVLSQQINQLSHVVNQLNSQVQSIISQIANSSFGVNPQAQALPIQAPQQPFNGYGTYRQ